MAQCVRAGCPGGALAAWWALCEGCTLPLLDPAGGRGDGAADQQAAAGWDAMAWAERIAPGAWGNASDDSWIVRQRCLVFAAVVTGQSRGCPHTVADVATPVVAVARAPGVLRCPPCAESVVASTSTTGHACDRCGLLAVSATDRVALVTGASLVVVAQLCAGCAAQCQALDAGPPPSSSPAG